MSPGEIVARGCSLKEAQGPFRRWAGRVAEWLRARADYSAAAALYQQLNRLSDAELHRRGLSRSTLAREVVDAVERRGRP